MDAKARKAAKCISKNAAKCAYSRYRRPRYSRERALQSLPALRVQIPEVTVEIKPADPKTGLLPEQIRLKLNLYPEEVEVTRLAGSALLHTECKSYLLKFEQSRTGHGGDDKHGSN